MRGLEVHDKDPRGFLAFDLRDILACLGPDVSDRTWTCEGIECSGEAEEEFVAAAAGRVAIPGRILVDLSRRILQIIDGTFYGRRSTESVDSLVIACIDSTFWEVHGSDECLRKIEDAFSDVRPTKSEGGQYGTAADNRPSSPRSGGCSPLDARTLGGLRAPTMTGPGESSFLNVDLDVEAPFDLAALVEALGDRVSNMYTGPGTVGFETHLELSGELVMPATAEIAIRGFVTLLTALPQSAIKLWDRATRKEFNIGFQGGTIPPAFEARLEPATIADVARLGASIGLTVYAFDPKSSARVHRRRTRR